MHKPIEPHQPRSRRSLAHILEATERLLDERPFSDLTVGDIAREAGVSTGLLYSRFRSKDEILPFLVERFLAEQREAFERDLPTHGPDLPVDERLGRLMERIRGMAHGSLGLLRAAAARRLLRPHEIEEDERARTQEIRDAARAWLMEGVDEVRRDEPIRAVEFVNWLSFLVGQLAPMLIDDEDELSATLENLKVAMTLFLTTPGPTHVPEKDLAR